MSLICVHRMRLAHCAVTLALLVLCSGAVLATDYFVRTDGSDSHNGLTNSAAGAFRSVNRCLNSVGAGDRCRIQPGRYLESKLTVPGGSLAANNAAACSCVTGSTTVNCTSDISSVVSAGQWMRCDSGDSDFYWTRVASRSGSNITLAEGYRGPTASGLPLDVANMVELRGDGSAPEDVVITQWQDDPGVTWTKESGLECTYSYQKSAVSNSAWKSPHALRQEVPWSQWDLWDEVVGGRDPYLYLQSGSCPCGISTIRGHVDRVPGSFGQDSSKVYIQTWDCSNPNDVSVQAGNQGSVAILKSTANYSVVSNLTTQASAFNEHSVNDLYRLAFQLGATNALYRDLVAESGRVWVSAPSGSYNLRFENFRMLNATRFNAGDYGLTFYNVEVRGGHPNQLSSDRLSGISATQRVIFDRLYLHRGWTHHRTADSGCNQQPNYNCSTKTFPGKYRATHGIYMGTIVASRRQDHITVQNSIIEITFDGLAIFHGEGSTDVVIRNNTFGFSGDGSQEFLWLGNNAGGSWGAQVYNNVFMIGEGSGTMEGALRHAGSASNLSANNNLFLYSGRSQSGSPRIWNSGETLESVISSYGQETNSIMVCKSGCSGSKGSYFNDGPDPRFVDWRTDDGDGTDYTPKADFRGIGKAFSGQCPPHDFYGNDRGSGACDIGAVEFPSGGSGNQEPEDVGNLHRDDLIN